MMKKAITFLYSGILYVISAMLLMYEVIYCRILSAGYLMKYYLKSGKLLERFHLSEGDLECLTREILAMMKGKISDSSFMILIDGEQVPFLNGKELRHLQEIAELLRNLNLVMVVLAILLLVSVLVLWKKKKLKMLVSGVYAGILLLVAFGAAAVFLSYQNLSQWIDGFHRIFFKGYQWVLNPATDRLIYLCPNQLFREAITTLIIIMSFYFLFSLVFASVVSFKLSKKKTSKSIG